MCTTCHDTQREWPRPTPAGPGESSRVKRVQETARRVANLSSSYLEDGSKPGPNRTLRLLSCNLCIILHVYILTTSALSSTNLGSMLIFASCVVHRSPSTNLGSILIFESCVMYRSPFLFVYRLLATIVLFLHRARREARRLSVALPLFAVVRAH